MTWVAAIFGGFLIFAGAAPDAPAWRAPNYFVTSVGAVIVLVALWTHHRSR